MAGDRENSDDELGRTATAPGSDPDNIGDAPALGNQLGRYRLQRELGRGGMGVVHAAFDPDLERRVALKVLRSAEGEEARQRLLREARAMARVTHANVVSVHEVGSVGGRDYIAMELVDGGTLEDWLASRHSEREIVDAFIAAGRGLAAAHAAGLVHRDFKPHNVLRRKDGRIVVTDFGLVVGIDSGPDALATTLRARSENVDALDKDTPSSLSGLTRTGSLLGTPAYMAPEQWTDGPVGPPADQFAFCVALWEALAKERPFRATKLDELKAEVCAGKHGDASKLPRRYRQILVRGLEPDPKKRWPSMDALLAALTRADRTPWLAIAIGAGALAAAAVTVGIVMHKGASAPACDPPVTDPAIVWNAKDAAALRSAHQDAGAGVIDRQMNGWLQARARVCKAPPATRQVQLACLDGVLARTHVIKDALLTVKSGAPLEIDAELISSALCEGPKPPRLVRSFSKELREVFAGNYRREAAREILTEDKATDVVNGAGLEPCAMAYAKIIEADTKTGDAQVHELDEAESIAERCGDDRVSADVALATATSATEHVRNDAVTRLKRAEAFVERVDQPALQGALEQIRALVAVKADRLDDVIVHFQKAIDIFHSNDMIRSETGNLVLLTRYQLIRGTPEDLAAIPGELDEMRRRLVTRFGEPDPSVRRLDESRAAWLWRAGQIAEADAMNLREIEPQHAMKPVVVSGLVVDEKGAPVAGADVAAGSQVIGDSLHAAMPDSSLRTTRTGQDGRFTIRDVEADSLAIAQMGDRRSQVVLVGTSDVTLTLKPTSRISGTVDLRGAEPRTVSIDIEDPTPNSIAYAIAAPVLADGTFTVDGVPRGRMRIRTTHLGLQTQASTTLDIMVDKPVIAGVKLEVKARGRTLRVLVRSTFGLAPESALIVVVQGHQASTNMQVLFEKVPDMQTKVAWPLQPEDDSPSVHAKAQPGDLFSLATSVPDGDASICAMPLPKNLDEGTNKTLNKPGNLAKVPATCTPVVPGNDVVIVEVQPWPRIE